MATLSEWRERFLAGGEAMLKSRENDAEDEEVKRLKSVVAGVCVDNERCARRSRAWRTAVLWHSGGRSHEPHGFAFQQKALWCGARSGAVEPGTFQLLCRPASRAASAGSAKARPEGSFRRRTGHCHSPAFG